MRKFTENIKKKKDKKQPRARTICGVYKAVVQNVNQQRRALSELKEVVKRLVVYYHGFWCISMYTHTGLNSEKFRFMLSKITSQFFYLYFFIY
jgi:hypothetical protein